MLNAAHVISRTRLSHFSAFDIEQLDAAWGRGYLLAVLLSYSYIATNHKSNGSFELISFELSHAPAKCIINNNLGIAPLVDESNYYKGELTGKRCIEQWNVWILLIWLI